MQARPLQQFYHCIERFRNCANLADPEDCSSGEVSWQDTLTLTEQAIKSITVANTAMKAVEARFAHHCKSLSQKSQGPPSLSSQATTQTSRSSATSITQGVETIKQQHRGQHQISKANYVMIPAGDLNDEPPWDDYMVNLGDTDTVG